MLYCWTYYHPPSASDKISNFGEIIFSHLIVTMCIIVTLKSVTICIVVHCYIIGGNKLIFDDDDDDDDEEIF